MCIASPDKVRGPNTSNNMKIAYNAWLLKSQYFKWGQFEHLKKELINAHPEIAIEHKRLLLEDILVVMLLQKGDDVLLLLSNNHHLLCKQDHGHNKKRNTTKMIVLLSIEPMRPECFKTQMYFAINMEVASNAYYDNFKNGSYTVDAIENRCAPRQEEQVSI